MSKILFTIYDDYILIDNITLIKEFNDTSFKLDINNIPYEVSGTNLVLNQVSNDNKTIKIMGEILCVKTSTNKPKEKTKFIKKLLS